jgi:hypothetical protein
MGEKDAGSVTEKRIKKSGSGRDDRSPFVYRAPAAFAAYFSICATIF